MADLRALFLATAVLACGLSPAHAEPLAVIEAGPTIPLSPYYSYLISGVDQDGVLDGITFPIQTTIRPARLMATVQVLDSRWLTRPLFVVGDDPASVAWLRANAAALAAIDASGVVLAATDIAAFKALQQIAGDQSLDLAPGPDPWLEQQLIARGAAVLPLLIGLDGRALQQLPGGAS